MRRRLISSALVAVMAVTIPVAAVSAGDSTHVKLTRTGAIASFGQVVDGLWVNTELSASTEAQSGGAVTPMLWLNQSAWAPDETGEYNVYVWDLGGSTSAFDLAVDSRLASATASVAELPVTRCDETGCVDAVSAVSATFTATSGLRHSHQRSIGSVSKQSMFVYNDVGASRFASATISVDGVTYGPSTGPADADIYDTRTGYIDMTKATHGGVARPAGVTVYDTTETPVGKRTGETVYAAWSSEADGIGRNVGLTASTQRVSSKGTVENQRWVGYYEQVYAVDDAGNTTEISFTQSYDTGSTATTIAVDKLLATGTLAGATIPAQSCTWVGEEALCIDTVVQASGSWTGTGAVTKTRDASTAGVAGVLLIQERNTSQRRAATVTATIDGETLAAATEAWLDRASGAFHEVHIGQ
jgi:hypothetical protein